MARRVISLHILSICWPWVKFIRAFLISHNLAAELTKIEKHGDKDDDAEQGVELDGEVDDGDDDVDHGRHDGEDDVVEEPVHRLRAAVHDSQNFARLDKNLSFTKFNWTVICQGPQLHNKS